MTSVPLAGSAKAEPVRQRPALETLRKLWPYMWPHDRPDLKQRVVVALLTLVAAKIITVLVPYTYKWAADGLVAAGKGTGAVIRRTSGCSPHQRADPARSSPMASGASC